MLRLLVLVCLSLWGERKESIVRDGVTVSLVSVLDLVVVSGGVKRLMLDEGETGMQVAERERLGLALVGEAGLSLLLPGLIVSEGEVLA